MNITGQQRRGLSRVEVVVVGVLLLIILGVLITGMRLWRERAAQVHCEYNLKTVGEAIFEYAKAQKHLPASCIARPYATWAVQLAPYLPQPAAEGLTKWDLSAGYYTQPAAVRQAQVGFFYCPARRQMPQESVAGDVPGATPDAAHVPGALGDYACSSGDGAADAPWDSPQANGAIIIGEVQEKKGDRIERWTARTFLDPEKSLVRGLSGTVLVGEKHVALGQWGQVAAGDGSLYNGDYFGSFARVGGPGFGLARSPTDPYHRNFGSYHPNVCNFLFADGGVQSYTPSVSEAVLGNLTNRREQ